MAERVSGDSGTSALVDIANLFGGQKTSTQSGADISGLVQLLTQLQGGQDPQKLLESIFQQASGKIPGIQGAFANAVGARSGHNSAVSSNLQELMKSTTLAAQQQIMQQLQNNQQLQLGAAGKIADSTRHQSTQQGTNLGRAGAGLAGLQLLSKAHGMFKDGGMKELMGVFGIGGDATDAAPALAYDPGTLGQGTLSSGNDFLGASLGGGVQDFATSPENAAPSFSFGDNGGFSGSGSFADLGALGDLGNYGGGSGALGDYNLDLGDIPWDDGFDLFGGFGGFGGFKDGGLVSARNNPKYGEKRGTSRKEMASYKPKGYADGGSVMRSPGGRVGSGASFNPLDPQRSGVSMPQFGMPTSGMQGMRRVPSGMETDMDPGSKPNGDPADAIGNQDQAATTMGPLGLAGMVLGMMTNPLGFMLGLQNQVINQQQLAIPPITFTPITEMDSQNAGTATDGSGSVGIGGSVGVGSVGVSGVGIGADGSVSGENASGDAASSAGDSGGGIGDSGDGGPGFKRGGKVKGPGTATSDSIPANLSDGEYVVPADVVQKLGVDFFENLRKQFHTFQG